MPEQQYIVASDLDIVEELCRVMRMLKSGCIDKAEIIWLGDGIVIKTFKDYGRGKT